MPIPFLLSARRALKEKSTEILCLMVASAADYLSKTQSCSRHLLAGIQDYRRVLDEVEVPVRVSDASADDGCLEKHDAWRKENEESLLSQRRAVDRYSAERFALSNLCGALLQIANMALTLFGNETNPAYRFALYPDLELKTQLRRYCVGRKVRGVPLGLIIDAGRNQYKYMHLDENNLRSPNTEIFHTLAANPGQGIQEPMIALASHLKWNPAKSLDPAFVLQNKDRPKSPAANVVSLLEWRSVADYEQDMRSALNIEA